MKKLFSLFTALTLCIGLGAQTTFISEVKISAEAGGTTNKQRLIDDGFTVIDQDLNAHEGGRDIYIGYKTTPNAAEAITGLLIMESGSGVDVRLAQYKTTPITYRGKNYYRCDSYGSDYVDCDLNRKSGGADITLYYTKDGNTNDGGTPFTVLTAVGENKSMTDYLYTRHWIYGTDMYSTAENDVYGNTNEDNGSYKIYLPYQVHTHAYTATFNWADNGQSCSVTTLCACGDGSTGDATITSEIKTPATYRVDGITTYTAKITLNKKEFTDTKDVQDIVMPLDEVKSVVKGMIDDMVAQEKRADMSSFGAEKKALVDAAATREEVWAILDAFPAALDAAAALALSQAKADAKADIQTDLQGVTNADILRIGNKAITDIEKATSVVSVYSTKSNARAEILRLKQLLQAKNDAKAAIQEALQGVTDEAVLAVANTACTNIDNASSVDMVNSIKSNALAEIQRLKELGIAKADAVAAIQSLVSGSTDELVISTANKYIAAIGTATTMDDVTRLRSEAESLINRLLSEPDAFEFGFIGTGNPTETQHALEGVKMTYSANGEQMIVTINGAEVTYPLSQVSELTYFRGTPAITLSTSQNPQHTGEYLTTFHSGLEAYTIPDGVTAYTAEVNNDQTAVILTAIEGGVLPQGEAVLLYTGNADPIVMNTVLSSVSASATNQLHGTDVRGLTPDNCLALNSTAGAFQHYTGQYFPANKAYLVHSAQAPLRVVFATEDTGVATGVEDTPTDTNQVEKFIQDGTLYIRKGGHVYTIQGMLAR